MTDARRTQPLAAYRRKRDFQGSPEPPGTPTRHRKAGRGPVFVVHKHQASRLHYDFRLEHNGVLLSWAIPKGPSLDPAIRRLAMAVEDHPLEYANFEGVIPEGEYGAGTVMVWDRGTYATVGSGFTRGLTVGKLKFQLNGKKLKGSWALVRTRGATGRQRSWLLIKHRDPAATKKDITLSKPRSAATNRLLAEIAWDEGGKVERAAAGDPPARSARSSRIRAPRSGGGNGFHPSKGQKGEG